VSDDMKMSGEEFAPVGEVAPAPAAPIIKRETISRNVLLIVAGVILAVVTVGLVVYALSLATPVAPVSVNVSPVTTPGGGTTSNPATAPLLPVPAISNDDVFTPRNPFTVIPPIAIAVPSEETSESNNTTETSDADTLTLRDIVTVGGVRKAVVRLNGHTYTLAAGETVDSSSWSIQEVNTTNIVALYGDVSVTISLGSK
jgi:hypothetical protein